VKRESQSDRILRVLRSACELGGIWLSTSEILRGAGYCSFSARVSELRRRGYVIESRKIEGVPAGPEAWEYRLVSEPSEPKAA
jgi:hypothetical protein